MSRTKAAGQKQGALRLLGDLRRAVEELPDRSAGTRMFQGDPDKVEHVLDLLDEIPRLPMHEAAAFGELGAGHRGREFQMHVHPLTSGLRQTLEDGRGFSESDVGRWLSCITTIERVAKGEAPPRAPIARGKQEADRGRHDTREWQAIGLLHRCLEKNDQHECLHWSIQRWAEELGCDRVTLSPRKAPKFRKALTLAVNALQAAEHLSNGRVTNEARRGRSAQRRPPGEQRMEPVDLSHPGDLRGGAQ